MRQSRKQPAIARPPNVKGKPKPSRSERDGRAEAERTFEDGGAGFALLADSIPQLAWMAHRDGWIFWYNKRWYDYTGTTFEEMEGWGWRKVHHSDHVDRVVAHIQRSWETGEAWEDTFPLRSRDGAWRWFLSRALPVRDARGEVIRWFGTNTDITELREAEERQRLLLDELNHRVKNTLTAIQSIAHQTMKGAATVAEFKEKFDTRLLALSRVHNMLAKEVWRGSNLTSVIEEVLKPYRDPARPARIVVNGPDVWLGPTAAVTLAMSFQELATNAVKYGALKSEGGSVSVRWSIDYRGGNVPAAEIVWQEKGGPAVVTPSLRGFGTRLIEQSLPAELESAVQFDFAREGLVCRMRVPLSTKVSASV